MLSRLTLTAGGGWERPIGCVRPDCREFPELGAWLVAARPVSALAKPPRGVGTGALIAAVGVIAIGSCAELWMPPGG